MHVRELKLMRALKQANVSLKETNVALKQATTALEQAHIARRGLRRERITILVVLAIALLVVLALAFVVAESATRRHDFVLVLVAVPIVTTVGLAAISVTHLVPDGQSEIGRQLKAYARLTLGLTLGFTLALHFLFPEEGREGKRGARGEVVWRSAWSASRTYGKGDAVRQGGSSYVSLIAGNRGHDPRAPHGTAWAVLALEGTPGQKGKEGPEGKEGPPGRDDDSPPILPMTR